MGQEMDTKHQESTLGHANYAENVLAEEGTPEQHVTRL